MTTLNLVLLGLPSSGKSALLGSLQQAAQSQGAKLEGELVDLSAGELAKLREASLEEKYQPTRVPVAAYPLQRRAHGRDETFTLHDTSGAETVALLKREEPIEGKGPLPETLADADGVLLVVDASSSPADLQKQFDQFLIFLEGWQARRSQASQVGGLPVYLVLTKCDRLVQQGDKFSDWTQRIESEKKRVADLFEKKLDGSRDVSFGRIDVRVWATAAKRPAGKKPGQANTGPYQVAELFEQVFDAASAYRQRTERASQTLHGALVGLGSVAALLILLMTWYYATEPTPEEVALEGQVQALLAGSENSAAERVREPLDDRLKELRDIKANAAYVQLPTSIKDQVDETEKAILAYQNLNTSFQNEVKNPRLTVRERDLEQIEKALDRFNDKVAPWSGTRLAKRHQEWSDETKALKKALADEEAWTKSQIQEGEDLRTTGGKVIAKVADAAQRDAWFKAVVEYQLRGRRHKSTDRVEGTTIPYRVVYQFDRMDAAERNWREFKDRLEKLRQEALEK